MDSMTRGAERRPGDRVGSGTSSGAVGAGGLGRSAVWLAWAAIAGAVVFNAGWVIGDALQTAGYSVSRHDVSELEALTAQHPWVMLTASGIAGVLAILFALGALRPALRGPGRWDTLGAWLLAASLAGLDNLSDTFFRLDCRAADPGCTRGVAVASWHGEVHVIAGVVTAVATVAAGFVLAARMRRLDGWRDLARPALGFTLVFLAVLVPYLVLQGRAGGGYLQRALIVLLSLAVVVLALRVRRLALTHPA